MVANAGRVNRRGFRWCIRLLSRKSHTDSDGELPDTIYVGPSLAASLLWVVAFALRYWVRMSEHQLPILMALTDGLILFPPAAYVVMYWMIHRKYERLKGAPATNENAL